MSKLLNATKYAIEHRAEDTVQLFQVYSFNWREKRIFNVLLRAM